MKKELLSVLSLSLLISLAPGCCNKCEKSKKKNTTVKKIDAWNVKTLDDIAYNDDEEERSLAQVDTDDEDDEEVVTKF